MPDPEKFKGILCNVIVTDINQTFRANEMMCLYVFVQFFKTKRWFTNQVLTTIKIHKTDKWICLYIIAYTFCLGCTSANLLIEW